MIAVDLSQLKLELIQWITESHDPDLLRQLHFLASGKDSSIEFSSLSPEEQAQIERGLEDLKEGRTMDSSTFWKRVRDARGK
jgi:predicted transcriptional regulator